MGRRVGFAMLVVGVVLAFSLTFRRAASAGDRPVVIQPSPSPARQSEPSQGLYVPQVPEGGAAVRGRRDASQEDGTFAGRIIDFKTRRPLPGALFHARFAKRVLSADDEGGFRYVHESDEALEFEAGADGYCVTLGTLEPELLRGSEPIEIPLVQTSPLAGQVIDDYGGSVSNAYVHTVVREGMEDEPEPTPRGFPPGWTLMAPNSGVREAADDAGTFLLAGLVPSSRRYALYAWRPRFGKAVEPIEARGPGLTTRMTIVLERDLPPPSGVVEGRVFLNGKPVEARIRIRTHNARASDSNPNGSYRVRGVIPGYARAKVEPNGWEWPEDAPVIDGSTAEFQVGHEQTIQHDFHLTFPLKTIRGRIVEPTGNPAVEARVFATNEVAYADAWTDESGSYAIEVPDVGPLYDVKVWMPITMPTRSGVAAGSSAIDFVVPEVREFFLVARDAESGEEFHDFRVYVRAADQDTWGNAQVPDDRTARGYRFLCLPGLVDLQVRRSRYATYQENELTLAGARLSFELNKR